MSYFFEGLSVSERSLQKKQVYVMLPMRKAITIRQSFL